MPEVLSSTPAARPTTGFKISPRIVRVIAGALLVVLAILLFASVRQESPTFDEPDHLFAGFEYWKHGDFGRNPEHPPFAKLLASLPLLPMGLKEPSPIPVPYYKAEDMINGARFLYSGDADAVLLRARLVIAVFSIALALLVFLAAREMFGYMAGFLTLFLFVFEPTLLANGALVTTDMPLACLFFASVYAFYRYLKKPTVPRLALCAIATALGIATKQSGILILPTLLLLAVVDFLTVPTELRRRANDRRRRLGQLTSALVMIAMTSFILLWAIYGFRFAARPGQLQLIPSFADYINFVPNPLQRAVIFFFARHHILPEAYLYGWADILQISSSRTTFIFGRLFPSGQWFFFPAVFVIKSTLAILILLLLLPFARIHGRRRELLFLAIPIAFFFLVAVASMLNMGVRHLLPVYPFCVVLAGAAAASFARRSAGARIAVTALLLFTMVSSLHSFPDFLAYSNEIAGGPSHTYRMVTDSNVDWGQGMKWTKTYLDQHPTSDCWIGLTNPMADPAYYGIKCKRLLTGMGHLVGVSAEPLPPTITGTVILGGTEESGLLWGPGTLSPYAAFRDREPDAKIGNVMLVYNGTFDMSLLAAETEATSATNLLRQGKAAEALTLAQEAAQQAPDSAEIHHILATALLASGRTAEGKDATAETIRLARANHPEFQKYLLR